MKMSFTNTQVIDLSSSELPQDTISMNATRQNIQTKNLHFELNFFIL